MVLANSDLKGNEARAQAIEALNIHLHAHGTHTPRKELNLLSELLLAQQHISQWQFFPAVLSIQACETRLSGWHGVLPLDMVSHMIVM